MYEQAKKGTEMLSVLGKAFLISTVPLLEFLFLRYYTGSVLGIHPGYAAMTDYDFVPQSVLAFCVLFLALNQARRVVLRLSARMVSLNALALGAFLLVTYRFRDTVSYSHPYFMALWLSLALTVILSGLFSLLGPSYYRSHPNRRLIIPGLVLAASNPISKSVLDPLWEPVARAAGLTTYRFLKLLVPGIEYQLRHVAATTRVDEYTIFGHPHFTFFIGRGCSGLDGMFLLLFALGLVFLLDTKRFRPMHWLFLFAAAIPFMYVINVVRLSTYFLVALTAMEHFHAVWILPILHANLGWMLDGLGMAAFFRVTLSPSGEEGLVSRLLEKYATA